MANVFHVEPFKPSALDTSQIRKKWIEWISHVTTVITAQKIVDAEEKKLYLKAYGGPELQTLIRNIPGADVVSRSAAGRNPAVDGFQILVDKLTEHFKPSEHGIFSRHKFWSLEKGSEEPIEAFVLRLRETATECSFGNNQQQSADTAMIDKLLLSSPKELQEKLLQKHDLDLSNAIKISSAYYTVKEQVNQISKPGNSKEVFVNQLDDGKKVPRCGNCNLMSHDKSKCPARNEKCHTCNNIGHYARCCKSKKRKFPDQRDRDGYRRKSPPPKRYKSEYKQKFEPINNVIVNVSGIEFGETGKIVLNVGGISIKLLIDSGSNLNVMGDQTYKMMVTAGLKHKKLGKAKNVCFRGYNNELCDQMECFETDVVLKNTENGGKRINDVKFYVIRDGNQPILGKVSALALDVLRLGPPKVTETVNHVRVKKPFPHIKGVVVRFQIDRSVKPINIGSRRIPVALQDVVKDKLNELLETDIIERVQSYSPWCSPIVTTFKNNGELRLCIDMRHVNKAIKREYFPLPTFENLMPRLNGARYFSKLDIKSAFHQCCLDEESRILTTFITPWGRFRYKRLVFGVTCAPEIFQRVMSDILVDCQNVIIFIDDILIYAKTRQDHDNHLEKVKF